jgi:type IV pilus assembly protein PilO
MIRPANTSLTMQKEKVSQNMTKLRQLETAPDAIDDLQKQLAELEDGIMLLESKLPPKSEIHSVLKNITVIALQEGLTPKTIRTLKPKYNNGYIEQPLKLELAGNFKSYYSFLLALEKLDRITNIPELTIKKDLGFDGHMQATFVVNIFFQNSGA